MRSRASDISAPDFTLKYHRVQARHLIRETGAEKTALALPPSEAEAEFVGLEQKSDARVPVVDVEEELLRMAMLLFFVFQA